uniref:ABC transporter permease n=1 Tax=Fervidicoccus fontis TaxID=683846 RepID=A0A7J3ZLR9_9CREN
MIKYIVSRLLQGLVTVILSVIILFFIINLAPGDPIIFIVGGGEPPPPEIVEMLRAEYGLDRPVHERLVIYTSKLLRFDLGYSFIYKVSVFDLVVGRLKATVVLAMLSYVISTLLGVLLAIVAVRRPGFLIDKLINGLSTVFFSLPSFWVGQILILVFAVRLGLLPTGGLVDPRTPPETIPRLLDVLRHTILPLITLTLVYLGLMTRLSRSLLIETLQEDFITTARAKGLNENLVISKHALRVAMLPIITMANFNLAFLLSGSILVETVFSWPGVGTLLYDSILKRDYPVMAGIFYMTILLSVIINLITDLIYLALDPRVKLGERR